MLSIQASHILIFALTFLPSLVSARGRGGGGGSFSSSGGDSNFSLDPLDAIEFAFCVVFAVITALQALQALSNICRRANKVPPSITTSEYSVGPIFPICLLMTTLLLTTAYILQATYVGKTHNTLRVEEVEWSASFVGTLNAIGYLADIFLVSTILALLSHREEIMLNTPRWIRDVKAIADVILIVILLALSMGVVGFGLKFLGDLVYAGIVADAVVWDKLNMAYLSFFFTAAANIVVTSTLLYTRARKSSRVNVNGHFIIRGSAFIISPLFIVYALFLLLWEVYVRKRLVGVVSVRTYGNLAGVIVGCVTEVVIIQACLKFGMPPLPKKIKEVEQRAHSAKAMQAV